MKSFTEQLSESIFDLEIARMDGEDQQADEYESFGNDPYAATRRAIVRAAAEIGRTK